MGSKSITLFSLFVLYSLTSSYELKDIVSARIESCRGCTLNRLPEVRQCILNDAPKYNRVEVKFITGAVPELILLGEGDNELERLPLSSLTRDQCNKLLTDKGFSKEKETTPKLESSNINNAIAAKPAISKTDNAITKPTSTQKINATSKPSAIQNKIEIVPAETQSDESYLQNFDSNTELPNYEEFADVTDTVWQPKIQQAVRAPMIQKNNISTKSRATLTITDNKGADFHFGRMLSFLLSNGDNMASKKKINTYINILRVLINSNETVK